MSSKRAPPLAARRLSCGLLVIAVIGVNPRLVSMKKSKLVAPLVAKRPSCDPLVIAVIGANSRQAFVRRLKLAAPLVVGRPNRAFLVIGLNTILLYHRPHHHSDWFFVKWVVSHSTVFGGGHCPSGTKRIPSVLIYSLVCGIKQRYCLMRFPLLIVIGFDISCCLGVVIFP